VAKSGPASVTTHNEAVASYMKYKAGQVADAADPLPAAAAPDPASAHQAALEHA
jgi:hypothetical protein